MNRKVHASTWKAILLGAVGLMASATGSGAFSGVLSAGESGILGNGNWLRNPISLRWTVTQNADQSWHYSYVFSHAYAQTDYLILETSEGFMRRDIYNWSGDFRRLSIGWFDGNGNPGMPGGIYGIKFGRARGMTTRVNFDSRLAPSWRDFYSNDRAGRRQSRAYNSGFLAGMDLDPNDPAADGSIRDHALTPDKRALSTVPEPSSFLLLGAGLLGVGVYARRRRR